MEQNVIRKERIPFKVLGIVHSLIEAGGRAYIVGGAVRDLLLGLTPSDWDIATDLEPEKVLSIFPLASKVGIEFGRLSLADVDIVSLRQETSYRDSRHPDAVSFRAPLEKDLERRDFTVNSMALDPMAMEIFDPTGGREDLALGILSCVGDPEARFKEDPLRILRAIRLKTELGFNLEPGTLKALLDMKGLIRLLSPERVFYEFKRLILSNAAYQGIMDLHFYGLGPLILPSLFQRPAEDMRRLALSVSFCPKDLPLRFSVLHSENSQDDLAELFNAFNLPTSLEKEIRLFHLHCRPETIPDPDDPHNQSRNLKESQDPHSPPGVSSDLFREKAYLGRKITWSLGEDTLFRIIYGKEAVWKSRGKDGLAPGAAFLLDGFFAARVKGFFTGLAMDGNDVREVLGVEPGPLIGEALSYLTEASLRDPALNQKERLKRLLHEWWNARH